MDPKQFLLEVYARQAGMLPMHLADFSEDEMLVRPVAGANHAAWQVGHLAVSTARFVSSVAPGTTPPPSPEEAERFGSKGAKLDDGFGSKQQLLERFGQVQEACTHWLRGLSDADLTKSTPEQVKPFAATVGALAQMLPMHAVMHLGQIQVIRRKLGKPNLF
jgi:hypothetical protein